MIKKIIIKKLISKDGYFDRELLVELMQPRRLKLFIVKKLYKKFLRIGIDKAAKQIKLDISDIERIGKAFTPIKTNFFSKILKKLGVK